MAEGNRSSSSPKHTLRIKGSGGRGDGACASRAPGCMPPHLPAPLPGEFVKQISLIAQAEEFVVGKKKKKKREKLGKFPSARPPLPRPCGCRRFAGMQHVSAPRGGSDPAAGVSSGHPGLRGDGPRSSAAARAGSLGPRHPAPRCPRLRPSLRGAPPVQRGLCELPMCGL